MESFSTRSFARKLFLRALQYNNTYVEAITQLVQIDSVEENYTHAIDLLLEFLNKNSTDTGSYIHIYIYTYTYICTCIYTYIGTIHMLLTCYWSF